MATVNDGPIISEWMFITTIVQFFLCSLGLTMNGFLSYVIIRNKKLQFSCCAIFLLCLAIYDCIAEFFLVFLSTPLNLFQIAIPLLECFWLDCYCVFAQNCAQLMMCLISIDRLISIIFPLKYRQICIEHKWKYVAAFLCVPTIYVIYLSTLFHTYALANANKPVFCMPSDYVDPVATVITYNVMMGTNLLMLGIYCLIWALLRSKVVYKIEDSVDYRIHKSLLVLMLVTFFCWLPVPLFMTFVFPSLQQLSANSINDLQRALLQLNKAAQAMNAPILFVSSSQYRRPMRREMKRLWKLLFPCIKKPHSVIVPVDNYKI